MSLLALMEREGFDPRYNLTLLYPLAETVRTAVNTVEERQAAKA